MYVILSKGCELYSPHFYNIYIQIDILINIISSIWCIKYLVFKFFELHKIN